MKNHPSESRMNDLLREALPVVVSIIVIIAVAVLRRYSNTLAAITATMPLNVPLSLWIIYSAENGNQTAMTNYASTLFWGLLPTVIFVIVAWLALRAGWGLVQTIGVGYFAWAVGVGVLLLVRRMLGAG
ncbi:MAG: hypothetical protein U0694_07610 [Anaerolineae bacterium]